MPGNGPGRATAAVPGGAGRATVAVPGDPGRGAAAAPGNAAPAGGRGTGSATASGAAAVPGGGSLGAFDDADGDFDSGDGGTGRVVAAAVPVTAGAVEPGTGTVAVARVGAGPANAVPEKAGSGPLTGTGDEAAEPEGGLAELRRRLRTQRRLRLITLSTLAIVVLLVLPAFFGLRAVGNDPVFASLDRLNVPSWAARKVDDKGSFSRWCFLECRFRERTAESERPFKETSEVYAKALKAAGWTPWKVAGCPESPLQPEEGTYSCWKRDEFTLDLAVGLPACAVDQVLQEAVPPAGSEAAEAGETGPAKCEGSTVSIKVRNEIADERGKTDKNPGPVGETPDSILNDNDPLLEPTPEAS
ncbi:hypothetical protein [Actinoplanes teichomyceticus]|uniref:Integrin beta 3 n=1 Tax=Actinoplanes teichomyceticus TaxID=1867 RepID=A0A561VRD1_ACTTI|nr:hypothetical protein [Actinoplanes teichomyceticus]TWG14177.1 hypothetical protein FHX34_104477 [Actinoplanes teichomyceticus]